MNASGNGNSYSPVGTLFRRDLQFQLIEHIADLLPAIILVYDKAIRKFRLVNKQGLNFLGYDPVHAAWNERDWKEVIAECVVENGEDENRNKKAGGSFITVKDRNRNNIPCELHCIPLLSANDDNNLVLLILNPSSDNQEKQTDHIPAGDMERILKTGRWMYFPGSGEMQWSEGLYDIFGYPHSANIRIDQDFFLSHLNFSDQEQWKQAILNPEKPSAELEMDLKTRNGVKRVSLTSNPVSDENGHVYCYKGIVWDVSRYYNLYKDLLAGKNLSAANEYFLNTGSWEVNLETGKVTWSDGMYKIFGYGQDEKNDQDMNSQLLYKHLCGDREVERALLEWQNFMQEKEEYITEMQIITKDGRLRRIESCGRIIRDSGRKAVRVIGATRDITTLREYEWKLEKKVQELAQINKDLEEFAYVASHDLQEPLRKITTFSERITTKFSESLGPEGKMYLDRMSAAAENMRMLIENLLEFSRTARTNAHFEKCSLDFIVKDVLKELELKLEETQAIIKLDVLPSLEASPALMKQLFSNLLSNAIKFRKPGEKPVIGICSRSITDEERKKYSLSFRQKFFCIEVSDEGIGFEQEYADRIFKIFQRLHGKSEYPGSGIGLAICKKIIDFHNGIIYANSQPGTGSRFIFILPENQSK